MKFRIHNGTYEDYFVVEGETIEECREKTVAEEASRFWKDCWSERI